jgi:hypothetical protein
MQGQFIIATALRRYRFELATPLRAKAVHVTLRPDPGGDGGFLMHAGEILICVENAINLVLVIFNDGRLNMVHHGFQAVFGRRPQALPSPVAEIAGVARSFGAKGIIIEKPEDLDPSSLRRAADHDAPSLSMSGSGPFPAQRGVCRCGVRRAGIPFLKGSEFYSNAFRRRFGVSTLA